MKYKIKENSWIAKIAARRLKSSQMAITIGKTIFLHNTSKKDFMQNRHWVRHELQHIKQFKQYGFFRFLWLYAKESLRHGYDQNEFEIEARDAEHNLENDQWID